MTVEEWRDVVGYEGFYQVSNLGNVKSLDRIIERNGKLSYLKGKTIKACFSGRGYLTVGLSKNNKVKLVGVHRLVTQAFIPNPDNLPQVNHKDCVKSNNRVENLEWCSVLYNLTYDERHIKVGLKERGKKAPNRRKVMVFKNGEWYMTFISAKATADFFGVCDSTVRDNIYGKNHIIKGEYTFKYLD